MQQQGRDSRRRRDAARERFLREVRELPIHVPCVPLADLVPVAIDCRNRFQEHRDGKARPISGRADPDHVARLVVNFLKHQFTCYEQLIEDAKDYQLDDEVYKLLQGRVLNAISATYPDLAEECSRQKRKHNGDRSERIKA